MFRKEEKRAKIEENRRLKQLQDNNKELQRFTKPDVSYYFIYKTKKMLLIFLVEN
jgi:hypothetical protein